MFLLLEAYKPIWTPSMAAEEASNFEVKYIVRTVVEKLIGERSWNCDNLDRLTHRTLEHQFDHHNQEDNKCPIL